LIATALTVGVASQALAGSYVYTDVTPAGSGTSSVAGINNHDQVVGSFRDSNYAQHGFVWTKGKLQQVDIGKYGTFLESINDKGIAAGCYYPAKAKGEAPPACVGFTYDTVTGTHQVLDVGVASENVVTVTGINISGSFAGYSVALNKVNIEGFTGKGTTIHRFLAPNLTYNTITQNINDAGDVLVYGASEKTEESILYVLKGGKYSPVVPPGSVSVDQFGCNSSGGISPGFIANDGSVGGNFTTQSGETKGFIEKDGKYTIYSYPTKSIQETDVVGIGTGVVAGCYRVTAVGNNNRTGFVYIGKAYHPISVPGSFSTYILGINSLNSLAGIYYTETKQASFIAQCPKANAPCTK
jgi:probable HAF family extracellular repeat protein